MILTQEQLNQATSRIEEHLKDIGILNQVTLLSVNESEESEEIRVFIYQVANPTFKTTIQINYDFSIEQNVSNDKPSFSWMDYKKITE